MHRRLNRSSLHFGLWSASVLALLLGLSACSGDPTGSVDAGRDDSVPDMLIPPVQCWGPAWKCTDGGSLMDGGDPRAPIAFHADLTGALVVPPSADRDSNATAKVTLDGPQTGLTVEFLTFHVPGSRFQLRRGAPGEVDGETLGEYDVGSTDSIPVTAEVVQALLRGDLFLEVKVDGAAVVHGQILRSDEELYVAHLNGDEAATPHATTKAVTVYLVHNRSTDAYRYWSPATQRPNTEKPTSMELGAVGNSEYQKFADLDVSKDGIGSVAADPLDGFGIGAFDDNTKPSEPLALGGIVVKAHLAGTPGEELVGTLTTPGAQVYETRMDGLQLTPVVSTPHAGSARFVVNYLASQVAYSMSTNASASELSLRALGEDLSAVAPLFVFSSNASSSRTVNVGSGSSQISLAALEALEGGRAFVFVRSSEKDQNNADKYPNGELAGVIHRPGETVYWTELSAALNPGSQESPGTGLMWLLVNAAQTTARYVFTTTGLPAVKTVAFDVAPALAPTEELAPTIVLKDESLATFGAFELPAGSPFGAGLAIGATRVRIGLNSQPSGESELAGHFVLPGESLYVAGLFGEGIAPEPSYSQAVGYGMAVVDAAKSTVRIAASALTAVSEIKVCSGVAGVVGTNCTNLAAGAANVPWSATVNYDEAGFARGKWHVQVNSDVGAFPRGELRGPLVRPGEAVVFAYLKGNDVVWTQSTPAGPVSTGSGQIAFIVNAARSAARYDGTLFNLTPTGAGWGSLRLFQAQTGQAVPLFPAPLVVQSVTSTSLTGDITGRTLAFYLGLARGAYSADVLETSSTQRPDGTIRGVVVLP